MTDNFEFVDPTNTYEYWRDIQAETHVQDEELIRAKMSEDAAEWLSDPDNSYDIYMDSLLEEF